MGATILIVEDNALVVDAFTVLFGESGYTVRAARTVADAVQIGVNHNIDIMLLDVTLPDGSGLDVLATLRERNRLPRATLAMTGHTDPQVRRDCLDAGCTDVLVKPVPVRELLRQIERLLD